MLRTSWEPERENAPAQQIRDRLLRALAAPATAADGPPASGTRPPAQDAGRLRGPDARDHAGAAEPRESEVAPGVPSVARAGGPAATGPAAADADLGLPDESWPGDALGGGSLRAGLFGAFDPGRRGMRALVVAALVALLGAGVFAWYARPRVEPVDPPGPPAAAVPSPSAAEVVVAVSGRVHHPGLLRLPAGSRVADALEAAGGALPGTDLSQLNLARRLTDGELVVVGAVAVNGSPPGDGLVNLNTATVEDLDRLPGVGPTLAQRIVDYRTAHGGFRTVDQLREVDGIGPSKFTEIKDKVTV